MSRPQRSSPRTAGAFVPAHRRRRRIRARVGEEIRVGGPARPSGAIRVRRSCSTTRACRAAMRASSSAPTACGSSISAAATASGSAPSASPTSCSSRRTVPDRIHGVRVLRRSAGAGAGRRDARRCSSTASAIDPSGLSRRRVGPAVGFVVRWSRAARSSRAGTEFIVDAGGDASAGRPTAAIVLDERDVSRTSRADRGRRPRASS